MRFTISLVSILVFTCFSTFAQTFTVANYLPRNGSFHPADEQIQIAFSEDVDFSTVNKNNIIVKSEIGKTIEGNFSLTSSTNILFSPSDDYPLADVITILVKNDVLSSTGINCEPFTFQFNTAYPESGNSGFSSSPITLRRPSNNNGYTKIADLDGDGDNDIITSGYNTWRDWLENKGNDVFESKSMHNYDSDKPELLEITDIDEDGDVDLVIYDDIRKDLYILLNNGTGYFDSKITISTSLTMVTSISINDSDNDGDLDINVSDYSAEAIYSFKNDGNLNFTSTTITNDIRNPTDISLRDANGDGYLDFYVHGGYYGETVVFIYDKSNDIYNKTELIPGFNGWPSPSKLRGRVFVDDYDNDNDLDIITEEVIDIPGTSDVSAIYWYVNDGSNNYSKHLIHEHQKKNIWNFEVLDIEGDGDYDIYVNTYLERGKNLIYYNDGNYSFVKKELPGYPYKRSNVDFGDLDGNGTTDMLSFGGGADVSIAYFKQMDTLNLTTTFPLNNGVLEDRNAQIYFEFENTIDPDSFDPSVLIVRSSSGQIKKGTASLDDNRVIFTPDSSFKTGFEIHTYLKRNLKGIDGSSFSLPLNFSFSIKGGNSMDELQYDAIILKSITNYGEFDAKDNFRYTQRLDMNGQEKDQMAFMNTGETYYLDFVETDSISVNRIYNSFNGRAVFHDFNNDGALDFVSTDAYDSHVKINSGTNSFTEIGVKSSKTRIPAFYDLDFDGYEAPVLSNSDQFYSFSVYDNFSSPGSERMRMLFPPNSVGGLEFIKGDLDNDHQLDLLVNHASSNKLTILYKSHQRFTERLVDNDFNADALELADIDGDNDLDILSIAVSDSVVTIFENIGSYQFTKHRIEVLTSNSRHLQIIDVDGDDYKDIVVGSFKADSLKWYKNNGDLSFESKPILTEIPNAQILAAFDPDKDGNLEFTGISLDSADQEYDIFYIPQTNNPPYIKQEIGSIVKNEGFGTYQIDLDSIFGDYYGETLTYSLNHLADSAVSSSLSASMLTIEELGPGTSQNTITATDEVGKTVSLDYSIKNNKAPKIIVDSSAFILGTYQNIRLYGYQLFKDLDGTYLDSNVIMESNDLVTIDYYNNPTFRWSRLDISSSDSSGSVPIKFIIDDGQGGVDSASFDVIVNKRPQSIQDLPNVLVNIKDGKDTLNLNEYFTDFEGEQLGFSVSLTSYSGNDSASHVDIVNDSLLVVRADTLYGRDRYRVDATDSYGASWTEHMYIRVNGAPYLKKKFEDIVLRDYQSSRFDLMDYFADVDSYNDFDYYLHSSDTNIVKSSYEYNDRYTLTAQSFGVATVTFEAFDDGGLKAQDSIQVYVNDYPRIVADWSSLVLNQGFESYQISLDSIFTDLEDDSLYYDLTQGNGGLPAEIEGDILSIEETSTTDVIYYNLRAYDSIGGGNQFVFSVRVNEKPKLTTTLDTLKMNEEDSLMNHINLNDYFNDVDEIFYSINSSDTSIVKVDQESSYLSLFATSYGRSYIEIVAEDPYKLSTTSGFWVEANGKPYITDSIENQVVNNDTSLLKFTFADHFEDPEEDILQYSVTSDNNNVLIDKDDLGFSLDPQSIGWSKLSIIAIDDKEAKSEINFDVLINDIPEALEDEEFLSLDEGFTKHEINLNTYFSQTDDSDSLVFELVDEVNAIVSLDVINNQLVISEKGEFGSSTFTVIAKDIYYAKAKIPFEVNVNKQPTFTNSDSISVIYNEGFVADSIDLNPLFEDDNELTYKLDQLSLEDSDYLEAYLFEDMLIIKEVGNIGVIHFTLVGTDPYDLSDEIKFSIKINGAPKIGLIEDIELIEGFESYGIDLEDFTNDPEGDSLSYEVFIDDNSLLNASITHNYLTIEEKDIVGVTDLLLVASDTYDAIDSVKFQVSILSKDETVTSNDEAALENLVYFPNPVTDFLFIKDVLIKNIKSLILVDVYGRQQNPTYFIDEKLIKVDFSRTSKGIYFLIIMNEDGSTKSIKVNKD